MDFIYKDWLINEFNIIDDIKNLLRIITYNIKFINIYGKTTLKLKNKNHFTVSEEHLFETFDEVLSTGYQSTYYQKTPYYLYDELVQYLWVDDIKNANIYIEKILIAIYNHKKIYTRKLYTNDVKYIKLNLNVFLLSDEKCIFKNNILNNSTLYISSTNFNLFNDNLNDPN